MDNDSFKKYAHDFIDWIADYLENVEKYPVVTSAKPGDIRAQLPVSPPERAEPVEKIFKDFEKIIIPGLTHWQHPSFFGYFPANTSPPSLLAEFLTAALGVICMSWQTCPAGTELEDVVMEWLRQMIGLPEGFTGVIQDTASTATLVAFITAREKSTGFGVNREGFRNETAGKLTVYASEESHSSIEKGAKIAGFGKENIRLIPTDDNFAMLPQALEEAIEMDIKMGLKPCCVVAALGTTSSLAIDPVREAGEICRKHDIWLHVDAAMAGTAAILPEMRYIMDGCELSDSFVFNPHKWMLTNFDCSAYFVKDPGMLIRTFEIHPEYLKTDADKQVKNYRDWGIQLGRRFRALKLWFVIRSYGLEQMREIIRKHLEMMKKFASWIREAPNFEILAPVNLNLVCFRYNPRSKKLTEEELDVINKNLMDKLNSSGDLFLTHTRLKGKFTLRLCAGKLNTTIRHMEDAWQKIQSVAETML